MSNPRPARPSDEPDEDLHPLVSSSRSASSISEDDHEFLISAGQVLVCEQFASLPDEDRAALKRAEFLVRQEVAARKAKRIGVTLFSLVTER